MNSRGRIGFERDYAQSVNNAFPRYAAQHSRRNVTDKTQARARTSLRKRLNRYPSPSLWSGPPRVRPPLFPYIKTRRQLAESNGFLSLLLGFATTYLWSAKTSQNQEGQNPCGSNSSPSQPSRRLRLPAVATRPCSKACSVQAQASPALPFWAAIWGPVQPSAHWATWPIARPIRRAADLTTFLSGQAPDPVETACQTIRLAGRNALCGRVCPATRLGKAI